MSVSLDSLVTLGLCFSRCIPGLKGLSTLHFIENFQKAIALHGFPGGSVVKNRLPMQKTQVTSLGQEDPVEKEMAKLQYSSLGNPMDKRA